jgi:hypothetical protein
MMNKTLQKILWLLEERIKELSTPQYIGYYGEKYEHELDKQEGRILEAENLLEEIQSLINSANLAETNK